MNLTVKNVRYYMDWACVARINAAIAKAQEI